MILFFCSCTTSKKAIIENTSGSILLDGSKSYDPDGFIVNWGWRQIAGPAASLVNTNKEKAGALVKQEAWYSFELTVTDNYGAQAKDTTTIKFKKEPPKFF